MTINAQNTDGFFRGGNNSTNRDPDPVDINGGINNYGIGETVPLGSGLLILTAIGAGYAIARRKKHCSDASNASKFGILLLAFSLVLGITSCKKKVETVSNPAAVVEGVHITLDVCGDDGSKVTVTPGYTNPETGETYASVEYENGDKIYVGYNNAYVGELTFNGTTFEGNVSIAAPVGDQPLHFYLLGGKNYNVTRDGNTATVVISDQSEHYPVISYYHSTVNYTGAGTYTSKLRNKCSIMKFNVETPSTSPICIMGMNNKVTVDFTNPGGDDNGFSYYKDGVGEIKMHSAIDGSGTSESPYVMWAIVLPQSTSSAIDNGAYTSTTTKGDYYTGTRPAISTAIGSNQYISTGVNLNVNETPKFSVSASQKVEFAPANLQYTISTGIWGFTEHQYTIVEEEDVEIRENYTVYNPKKPDQVTYDIVTLFKWGANGLTGGEAPYTTNANDSPYTANLTSEQDWGVQVNTANLGGHNDWRTPSMDEWEYVVSRKILDNKDAYGFAVIDDTKGFILLPDNWNGAIDPDFVYGLVDGATNRYTASSWLPMEAAGVVFLPAAGYRAARYMTEFWYVGTYWSTGYGGIGIDEVNHNTPRTQAYALTINYYGLTDDETLPDPDYDGWETDNDFTYYASSVRLIRNVE